MWNAPWLTTTNRVTTTPLRDNGTLSASGEGRGGRGGARPFGDARGDAYLREVYPLIASHVPTVTHVGVPFTRRRTFMSYTP